VSQFDRYPRVSDTLDGRYAIAWVRYSSVDQYGSGLNPVVMAQCFAENGTPTSAQFIASSYDPASDKPDVVMGNNGTFIVTWIGPDIDYSEGVQARIFDVTGAPLGDQFRVNALADARYYTPAICIGSDNSFVITWEEYFNGTGYQGIYAQRFNAAGAKIGITNFEVYGGGPVRTTPDIDITDNGNFVIVYKKWAGGSSDYDIAGQRYDSSGTKLGAEFWVNTTINTQSNPRVSMAAASGLFVVAWQTFADGWDICAQRYNAAGTALGGQFLVNTKTAYWQMNPDVACDRDGNFTVVWQSYDQPDDPITEDYGIVAKSYNSAGVATTGDYVVNNPGLAHRGIGNQENPSVSRKSGTGTWTAAWWGYQGVAPSGGILGVWRTQVVGSPLPSIWWGLSAPVSGTYVSGTTIPVSWVAVGAQAGYTVCLCVAPGLDFTGARWISVGAISADNGWTTWNWDGRDTSGILVPPGTYYIAGYIWNGSSPTYAHATTPFILTEQMLSPSPSPSPSPSLSPSPSTSPLTSPSLSPSPSRSLGVLTFNFTAPISGTYFPGSTIQVQWNAGEVPPGSTVDLYYLTSADWSAPTTWIGVTPLYDGATMWSWNTAGVPSGLYYMACRVTSGAVVSYFHAPTRFMLSAFS
jgi:hypothetical protein